MNTTKETPTKIKLGDIELDGYQFPDGSYAAQGLFRLLDTDIYRYEDCWYCLNPDLLPILEDHGVWDWDRCLCFEGNRLSYAFYDQIDPEGDWDENNVECVYVPVANNVGQVIDFCIAGQIVSEETAITLLFVVERCNSDDLGKRMIAHQYLLRNTGWICDKLEAFEPA